MRNTIVDSVTDKLLTKRFAQRRALVKGCHAHYTDKSTFVFKPSSFPYIVFSVQL